MTINVKKLNGTTEPLNLNKILRWGDWAASESPDVSFESVLTFISATFFDGMQTSDITEAICKACEDLAKSASDEEDYNLTEQYNKLALNLYIPNILKKANYFQSQYLTEDDRHPTYTFRVSHDDEVPLPRYKIKSIIKMGIDLKTYDPSLLDGSLSDEFFEYADSQINYENISLHPYGGLRQIEEKYLRRSDGSILEDPEQLFALMAIAATHSDARVYPNGTSLEFQKETFTNYLRILSLGEMNSPTPFLLSLRTDFKQYDSCCLAQIGDTNLSIKAGVGVAMDATIAGAGVGISMGEIRSKGTRFRKMGVHQGVLGYLGQLTKTVKASNQECYSEDTEVLTDRGYVLFTELTELDLIVQVDDNLEKSYSKAPQFAYRYNGDMYHFEAEGLIDILVTPNHNMLYKEEGSNTFSEKYASDYIPKASDTFYTADGIAVSGDKITKTLVSDYNGSVYCVEVPTHKLLVRRNGKTLVCGNSRGGGATVNFPLWTRDIFDLVMLKDVTGVEGENRYRHLDYCFHFSMYMVEKLKTNGRILLVSPHTEVAPGITVHDAFYKLSDDGQTYDPSLFEAYCEEQLKNTDLPHLSSHNSTALSAGSLAYTTAYELFGALIQQMMNTGRIYTFNVDNVNNHSSFLDSIYMTNLCVEILQPTKAVSLSYNSKDNIYTPSEESEVSFCQLAGIVLGRHVTKEDLPRICYWTLRLQESIFNISDYSSITFSHRQKKRRNIGIGLVNLQHLLVREVYSKYPQKDWVKKVGEVTHEWYEAVQYNLILASTQIAEVLGPCEMIDRSTYGHGILPIDHYRKSSLTDFPLQLDWEALRERVIKYKSRFSTLSALMPAESSSVVFGTINGIEFPRQASTYKGNKKLSVLVTVPEVAKYGKHYVYAWGDYSVDVNKLYLSAAANIAKFADQGISYNTYIDYNKFPDNKVPEEYLYSTLIIEPAYAGVKTTYYINFNTDIKVDEQTSSEELSEEEKEFYENLKLLEQSSGCTSGACEL